MPVVDQPQGSLDVAGRHGPEDLAGCGVPVGGHEREERAQRAGVHRGVDAVTARGPSGGWKHAVALVGAHGLGGQSVLPGEVDGAQAHGHGSTPG